MTLAIAADLAVAAGCAAIATPGWVGQKINRGDTNPGAARFANSTGDAASTAIPFVTLKADFGIDAHRAADFFARSAGTYAVLADTGAPTAWMVVITRVIRESTTGEANLTIIGWELNDRALAGTIEAGRVGLWTAVAITFTGFAYTVTDERLVANTKTLLADVPHTADVVRFAGPFMRKARHVRNQARSSLINKSAGAITNGIEARVLLAAGVGRGAGRTGLEARNGGGATVASIINDAAGTITRTFEAGVSVTADIGVRACAAGI
jgi:hypothetical protein